MKWAGQGVGSTKADLLANEALMELRMTHLALLNQPLKTANDNASLEQARHIVAQLDALSLAIRGWVSILQTRLHADDELGTGGIDVAARICTCIADEAADIAAAANRLFTALGSGRLR